MNHVCSSARKEYTIPSVSISSVGIFENRDVIFKILKIVFLLSLIISDKFSKFDVAKCALFNKDIILFLINLSFSENWIEKSILE